MNGDSAPGPEDLTALRLLQEIELNPSISQREISRRVGVSLGLTNLLIQRMVRRAWIKIRSVPGRRLLYAITPRGIAEKIRKTRDFVRLSFRYYVDMRRSLEGGIRASGRRNPRVAAFGAGDLTRIVAEAAEAAGGRFLELPDGEGTREAFDVLVLMKKVPRAQRRQWEREGIAIVDLSY